MPSKTISSHSSQSEAVERIKTSNTIAIVLPEHVDLVILGAAHAFAEGLRSLGKSISVFSPPVATGKTMIPWRMRWDTEEPLREFIISFDLAKSPIKELRYEKAENRLDIILSPTGSKIRREDVDFRNGPLRYDLVVMLGVRTIEDAQSSIAHVPELLHEKPIVNIDVHPENRRYGEINLVADTNTDGTRPTIPELIYDVLRTLNAEPNTPENATALLASLVTATKNFHPLYTGASAFRMAAELAERGADPASLHASLRLLTNTENGITQLVGRAMARSRFDTATGTLWLTLTRDDFLKTHTPREEAENALERILAISPHATTGVLLSQELDSDAVHLSLSFAEPRAQTRFREHSGLAGIGSITTVPDAFPTFPEAETEAARLLESFNAVE
jgi:nanoRNase/pAp phosphatase (c-di-AMP/oligoRNAs hydrolase)